MTTHAGGVVGQCPRHGSSCSATADGGDTSRQHSGKCRHMQISELFSMEEWDQAVVDFLAATEVRKFPPK